MIKCPFWIRAIIENKLTKGEINSSNKEIEINEKEIIAAGINILDLTVFIFLVLRLIKQPNIDKEINPKANTAVHEEDKSAKEYNFATPIFTTSWNPPTSM